MTTHIQAAIEALTRYTPKQEIRYENDGTAYEVPACHEDAHGQYFYRQDVLAALQAAQPVQSIDTEDERAMFDSWHRKEYPGIEFKLVMEERWNSWQARAHIAQRAPVAGTIAAYLVRSPNTGKERFMSKSKKYLIDMWENKGYEVVPMFAAPAPIADAKKVRLWRCTLCEEQVTERCADSFCSAKSAPIADEVAGALRANLVEAAAILRKYEAYHRSKGAAESIEKAEVNAELAGRFEATIAMANTEPLPFGDGTKPREWTQAEKDQLHKVLAEYPPERPLPLLPYSPHGVFGSDQMRAYVLADRAARQAALAVAGQELSDTDIETIWRSMPGGPAGWLKSFGYLQFAREIETAILDGAAPAGHAEPVAWASCDKIGNGLRALTKFSTEESEIDRFVAARQAQYPALIVSR